MIGTSIPPQTQTYGKGLEGLIAGDSAISQIDGINGKFWIRGYSIEELAANSTFEEASYLVLMGELPNPRQLDWWSADLAQWSEIPQSAFDVLEQLPESAHPLAKYRTALSVAACHIPEAEKNDISAQWRRPARILAWTTSLAAGSIRRHLGLPRIAPRDDLSFCANFLWQVTGKMPSDEEVHAFEVSMIVQIEHGVHAAALAALTVVSTGTDLGSAVLAGMGALSGKLHGGANQTAFQMIAQFKKRPRWRKYF